MDKIKQIAEEERRSVNATIQIALERYIEQHQLSKK